MTDIQKLKTAAENTEDWSFARVRIDGTPYEGMTLATVLGGSPDSVSQYEVCNTTKSRAEYIALASPVTILKLLEERERMLDILNLLMTNWPENKDGMDFNGPLPIGIKTASSALAEIAQLSDGEK